MPSLQGEYATVKNTRFYYELSGQGQPLVLINAGDLDCRMWDGQVVVFNEFYQVVRYDGRGYGRTITQQAEPFRHIDDLSALMDVVGVETAALLGSSFGAKIALDFALQYPQRVCKLVLVSPGLSGYEFSSEIFKEYSQLFNSAFEKGDIEEAIEISLRIWVDGWTRPPGEVNSKVRQQVKEMLVHAYAMPEPAEPEPLDPPALARLAEVQKPVFVVTGAQDIPDILSIAEILSNQIVGAKRITIPNTAHLVNMEQADIFNQQVLAFLRQGSRESLLGAVTICITN